MEEVLANCPFCGNSNVQILEDKVKKGIFKGSLYCYASCFYCRAQGPNFYKVDMTDEEAGKYALKLWNDRREISVSQELKGLLS